MSSARKGFLKSALVILHIFSTTEKVRQFYPVFSCGGNANAV